MVAREFGWLTVMVRVPEVALGAPLAASFLSFEEPLAAASIAQVHRATTTRDPPRAVAVKVLRPNVEIEFARDYGRKLEKICTEIL